MIKTTRTNRGYMPTIEYWISDDDGVPNLIAFPAHYDVCGRCRGSGVHVNPSIDGNGLSREDFDADPDFSDAYFSGCYDVTCYECKGLRVVPVLDEDRFNTEQVEWYAKFVLQESEESEYRQMCKMERMMGA